MGISDDAICVRQTPYTGAALHPPADEHGAATVNKAVHPGIGGVKTTLQPARPEPKILIAGQAADDAKAVARQAETACSELEDARISLAAIDPKKATPAQIGDAKRRLDVAQAAADAAVKRNVQVQTTLYAERKLALKTADAELVGPYRKVHDNPHPDRSDLAKLAALQEKRYLALVDSVQSGRSVAVAMSLRDIAKGIRPGRGELARDTQLKDAKAAETTLKDARQHLYLAKVDHCDITEIKRRVEQVQRAASVNRAEWAALNEKAKMGDDAGLQKMSRRGLDLAERELEWLKSPRFIRAEGL
jgi:hypothetical protein